jgi:hypothetical protein
MVDNLIDDNSRERGGEKSGKSTENKRRPSSSSSSSQAGSQQGVKRVNQSVDIESRTSYSVHPPSDSKKGLRPAFSPIIYTGTGYR